MRHVVLAALIFLQVWPPLFAAEPATYEYPELLVQPQASDRLASEAKEEKSSAWTAHLPIQTSAVLTLLAGISASSDKADSGKTTDEEKQTQEKNAGQIATMLGGGWIATTVLLSVFYRPYHSGLSEIKKLEKGKNKSSQLIRERAAEEALDAPASLASRLTWLSASSNFVVGAYMVANAQGQNAKGMAAISTLGAFAPLLFSYSWEKVADQQKDYKKRIYGPITSGGVLYNEDSRKIAPAFFASLNL